MSTVANNGVPDPYGGTPGESGAAPYPDSLVRRPSALTYGSGAVFVAAGVMIAVFGIRQAPTPDIPLRYIWLVLTLGMALLVICAGLTIVARRTVFDATGIHSRGLIRRVDLPWPDTRTAFVVDTRRYTDDYRHRSKTRRRWVRKVDLRVQVMTSKGAVTLAEPRVQTAPAASEALLRSRLEADLDGIWAWALARGYTREWTSRTGAYWGAAHPQER